MKLFASNLTDKLKTGRNIKKICKIRSKGGHVGVTWPTFGILGS